MFEDKEGLANEHTWISKCLEWYQDPSQHDKHWESIKKKLRQKTLHRL